MENKKTILSIQDLEVKFRVRGRTLTAIRKVSLDIYENESIAIVGESGSGKSVFTKTFAGMLDDNGYISNGKIEFNDDDVTDTWAECSDSDKAQINSVWKKLNEYSKLEPGAATYREMEALKEEKKAKFSLSAEDEAAIDNQINDLVFKRTELFNLKQTIDPSKEKDRLKAAASQIDEYDEQIKQIRAQKADLIRKHKSEAMKDTAYQRNYENRMSALKGRYSREISAPASQEAAFRNETLAKEVFLSASRYPKYKRGKIVNQLLDSLKQAMTVGVDLNDESQRNAVFDRVTFRVRYLDEDSTRMHGSCVMNLAKLKDAKEWTKIRGKKIATVFQDPMTSLDPIITIGKQISSIIIKHQHCTEAEARARALVMMKKVGIPNAEKRFDDYPFQYSGGMRQRIVIAIALSCQPKILICDEPTTALDVTIQAQILKLLKDLQKEFNYTIVFITHDLGVVANVADRVAVIYAGQIVELGTVEDVFYDPRHPYTWALLSSLPQLAQKNTKLYSITGTPPSLYNRIVGDPFAPRNPYCLKVDTLKEPPVFQVSETHFAKTWLLDPRAPKVEKPEIIENIHEKLMNAFNI